MRGALRSLPVLAVLIALAAPGTAFAAAAGGSASCTIPLEIARHQQLGELSLDRGPTSSRCSTRRSSTAARRATRSATRCGAPGADLPEGWVLDASSRVLSRSDGTDAVRLESEPDELLPAASGGSFWGDMQSFALTWLPIIFMGLIAVAVVWMVQYMPRTKPSEIAPSSSSSVRWERRGRLRGGEGRAPRGRGVHARPEALQAARREGPQGHPAARPARHRQDAARQGGCERVEREVLRPVGVLVRRDVRRAGSGAHPAALPPGPQGRPRDRVHRRARRRGRHARQRHLGREGPDAEPAARGARRLRRGGQRGRDRGVEPAREARPGAAPARPLRPPDPRHAAGSQGPPQHPQGAHQGQAARRGRGHGGRCAPDERHDRRRPRQHLQRGGDLRRPRAPRRAEDARTSRPRSSGSWRACSRAA